MERKKQTNAPITPIRLLPGDSAPLGVINTAATRGGNGSHSRWGGRLVRKDTSPIKKKPPKEKTVWITVPSPPPWRTTALNLEFKPWPLVILAGAASSHREQFFSLFCFSFFLFFNKNVWFIFSSRKTRSVFFEKTHCISPSSLSLMALSSTQHNLSGVFPPMCHAFEWVIAGIWMGYTTRIQKSHYTYKRVTEKQRVCLIRINFLKRSKTYQNRKKSRLQLESFLDA